VQAKKTIYLIASTVFGIILSCIAHAVIEIIYLQQADNITWYSQGGVGACALPPAVQYGLVLIGIVGGYFLGRYWWKIVYIERRHWRFREKNRKLKSKIQNDSEK